MAEQFDSFGEPMYHTGGDGIELRFFTLDYLKLVYHNSEPEYPTYDEIARSEFYADMQSLVDQYGIKLLDPNDESYGWSNGFVIREHTVNTCYKVDLPKLEAYMKQTRGQ